ncbi:MAG: hypothetical protein ACLFWM_11765, partial [Actinomycetota bacterium]
MTSTSSATSRIFTGQLRVGDESIAAHVRFADGSVSLIVGQDEVGAWPKGEVGFVDTDDGYDIEAEGDSVRFVPDSRSDFAGFVASPPDEAAPPPSAVNGNAPSPEEIGDEPVPGEHDRDDAGSGSHR